ncbi:hypothetical protein R3P38DRAFT_1178825 [Favolaschia claudopus]|uniref:FAD dependent oxidoreductase domain-containing protein n=1 Tax=Favolaschia claudopus TaxID=2862362 RepID=A0AAW0DZ30_9AGAR
MALEQRKTLIIGSGCFGLSTALALLKRGWTDVTVIDRSSILPAPDGASNDLNRTLRGPVGMNINLQINQR